MRDGAVYDDCVMGQPTVLKKVCFPFCESTPPPQAGSARPQLDPWLGCSMCESPCANRTGQRELGLVFHLHPLRRSNSAGSEGFFSPAGGACRSVQWSCGARGNSSGLSYLKDTVAVAKARKERGSAAASGSQNAGGEYAAQHRQQEEKSQTLPKRGRRKFGKGGAAAAAAPQN